MSSVATGYQKKKIIIIMVCYISLKLIDSINAFTLDHIIFAGWIVMGSLVAIVTVLAGIVITILLIVIFVLWKR